MDTRIARDSLSASWLAERLAVEPRRLEAMRRDGELIAVRPEGSQEHYYPVWQFDEDWRPSPVVPRLVRAARDAGLADNRLYELLNARAGLGSGRRLTDVLREGGDEHVLAAVRSARP